MMSSKSKSMSNYINGFEQTVFKISDRPTWPETIYGLDFGLI